MSLGRIILTIDEDTKIYPNRKAKKCTCLNSDNTKYQADIPEHEVKLELYLINIKHKLTQNEMTKLKELISEYGHEQYSIGAESENID